VPKVAERGPVTAFYGAALQKLVKSEVPFMIAGAYALSHYTGIVRDTKDIDLFCTPGDYPRILEVLRDAGYDIEVTDANWICKAFQGEYFVDVIFNSANGAVTVDQSWLKRAPTVEMLGCQVQIVPVTELVYSKVYIEDRYRYDGADVNHLILKQGNKIDWRRLLRYMDRDWQLLQSHVANFFFVYPSERDNVPRWLVDEFIERSRRELDLPVPQDRVCRGRMLSRTQYRIDLEEWGFKET
jgi:hypothetical protein